MAVGDLIGWSRGKKKVTYDSAPEVGWFDSHSDIVVNIDKGSGRAYSIGGNVGQSVSKRELKVANNGKLASQGLLVHIRNNIGSTQMLALGKVSQLEKFA